MLTLELCDGNPYDAYTTLSQNPRSLTPCQNLIHCSKLSQAYCKMIGWYWKIIKRQLWTLTWYFPWNLKHVNFLYEGYAGHIKYFHANSWVSWQYSLGSWSFMEIFTENWTSRRSILLEPENFPEREDFAFCITLCHIQNIIQISLRVQVPGNRF